MDTFLTFQLPLVVSNIIKKPCSIVFNSGERFPPTVMLT